MPPSGPKYSTVSRFEDEKDTTPQSVWSLVVELGDLQTESRETIAAIWFLSEDKPDAPLHLLHAGSRFELLEGQRVVARGEVLD
jgi:hypothetical protein